MPRSQISGSGSARCRAARPARSWTCPASASGHATVWRDEPDPPAGRGAARTGVTVVDPGGNLFRSPVPAGGAVLNGAGECTGFLAAAEWGLLETPIFLTSTMQLGRVFDAACELLIEEEPAIGDEDVVIPVVAECDDSFLNDARRMQVEPRRRRGRRWPRPGRAPEPACRPPEGAVGAGTGMCCLGFKGGIGTASRVVDAGHTVGVLAMTNFGEHDRLTVDGVPVGRLLPEPPADEPAPGPAGSCIVVVLTDAPVDSAGCTAAGPRAGGAGTRPHRVDRATTPAARSSSRPPPACAPTARRGAAGVAAARPGPRPAVRRAWSRRPRSACSTACSRRRRWSAGTATLQDAGATRRPPWSTLSLPAPRARRRPPCAAPSARRG